MICTSDLVADEFNGLDLPSHSQFTWVRAQGVSHDALTSPTWPRAALVTFSGSMFEFCRSDQEGERALIFLVDDDFGHIDLVAWNPRTGKFATWLGRAWAVGQDRACTPWRIDQNGALPVFRTILSWLQAGRDGVVILDASKTADAIIGPVLAEDAAHKRELDCALSPATDPRTRSARNAEGNSMSKLVALEKPPRFQLIPFREILISTAPAYVVKGLIPRSGLVVIWGPPKCGKSFWAFDLSMHIALGWEYRGHRVKAGPVVYLVLEGDAGFRTRVEAWRQRYLGDNEADVPFYDLPTRINLIADVGQFISDIRLQMGTTKPSVVVVDTLNRSLAGSESSDEDMAKYVQAADTVREAFDCAVLIVHHCGIDASRPRGHTSLGGAADAQLAVKRTGTDDIDVTVQWMKDGPEGEIITSRLEAVEVGVDNEGDIITSCVIAPANTATQPVGAGKADRLAAGPTIALRALQEAITEAGETVPASNHIPRQAKTVSVNQWRDFAYARGISSGEDRARQLAFKRATETLLAKQIVSIWEARAWLS